VEDDCVRCRARSHFFVGFRKICGPQTGEEPLIVHDEISNRDNLIKSLGGLEGKLEIGTVRTLETHETG
jgi:hypothetical protein